MNDQASQLRNLATRSRGRKSVRIIAVSSGKGGVGKTNICGNLAVALVNLNKRTVVVDADMGLANIDILFRLHPQFNLEHVISGEKTIKDIIIDGPGGIKIVPAASGNQSLTELTVQQRSRFIQGFAEFEDNIDFLLIDTGAGISKNVTDFIVAAGEVIIVITPEPTSVTDAYALMKTIIKTTKNVKFSLFVNMAENLVQAQEMEKNVILVAEKFLNTKIEKLGFMLKDKAVTEAVKKQVSFVLNNKNCKASNCMKVLANKLCNYYSSNNNTLADFAERIMGMNNE